MSSRSLRAGLLAVLSIGLVACGNQSSAPATGPATVDVITVHAGDLPLTHALVGRLAPTRVAEVRARVAGIVLERAYTEGSDVKRGDLLFRIDPAPLQATLGEREAALAQAEASARNADATAERYRGLAAKGVLSTQDLDDANAKAATSRAAVAQARAAVESARLDLSYARVTAPIHGRAGRALVTEGALVGQSTATELTTIEQIDPIYVNFSQPMPVVQQMRAEQASGQVAMNADGSVRVTVTLPDGSVYPETGKLDFSDLAVDPDTGSVSLRAVLPNADYQLLPGMFVDVTLASGTLKNVILVPQQALQRDTRGAYVYVVEDGKAVRRDVDARSMREGDWVIRGGLADGDVVIVNGIQAIGPGSEVKTSPWQPAGAAPAATTAD